MCHRNFAATQDCVSDAIENLGQILAGFSNTQSISVAFWVEGRICVQEQYVMLM